MARPLPLGVTFNTTSKEITNQNGPFDAYLYIDSGVVFDQIDILDRLLTQLENDSSIAILSAQVYDDGSSEDGIEDGGYKKWGIVPSHLHPVVVPIGRCVHMHAQLFTRYYYESYGERFLPDIFQGNCSDCVMGYLCAAISKRWLVSNVMCHHLYSMDGGSSGFSGGTGWAVDIKSPKTIQQLCQEGHQFGFGFEECAHLCDHNPALFNDSGYALNTNLYPWLKQNLFQP